MRRRAYLAGDLPEIAQEPEGVANVEQEAQAVRADRAVLGHDEDVLEEAVDGLTQLGCGRVALPRMSPRCSAPWISGPSAAHLAGEVDLGLLAQQARIRAAQPPLGAAGQPIGARVGGVQAVERGVVQLCERLGELRDLAQLR